MRDDPPLIQLELHFEYQPR